MKKLIITFLSALLTAGAAMGQVGHGYEIERIFHEPGIESTSVVRSEGLLQYKIESFKSVKISVHDSQLMKANSYILSDAERATFVEKEEKDGIVTYALLTFSVSKKHNEYVGYQVKQYADGRKYITVVLLSGSATRSDLDKFFKKK